MNAKKQFSILTFSHFLFIFGANFYHFVTKIWNLTSNAFRHSVIQFHNSGGVKNLSEERHFILHFLNSFFKRRKKYIVKQGQRMHWKREGEKKEIEEEKEKKKEGSGETKLLFTPVAAVLYFTNVKANTVFRYKINWKQKRGKKGYQVGTRKDLAGGWLPWKLYFLNFRKCKCTSLNFVSRERISSSFKCVYIILQPDVKSMHRSLKHYGYVN